MRTSTAAKAAMAAATALFAIVMAVTYLPAPPVHAQVPPPTATPTRTPIPNANPTPAKKLVIPLSFYVVRNADTPLWTIDNMKERMETANIIWDQANINFTWNETFNQIDDPDAAPGGVGDVRNPLDPGPVKPVPQPTNPPVKNLTGVDQVKRMCDAAIFRRDNTPAPQGVVKTATVPVILMKRFTPAIPYIVGFTVIKNAPNIAFPPVAQHTPANPYNLKYTDVGRCVLLSYEIKAPGEPKRGETLAHELGHVLCLTHPDPADATNLMDGPAYPSGNLLNKKQIAIARGCAERVRTQLGLPTNTPTPTPTRTPTPPSIGGVSFPVDARGLPLKTNQTSSRVDGLLIAGVAASALALASLGGAAWYARRRSMR